MPADIRIRFGRAIRRIREEQKINPSIPAPHSRRHEIAPISLTTPASAGP
jgi:hypothetical protein